MKTYNMQRDWVLVLRDKNKDTKSAAGVILPGTAKERPMEATVIAVGPGKTFETGRVREPSVKRGDRVLIGRYNGFEIGIEGVEHTIMHEDDVLAVIEESA